MTKVLGFGEFETIVFSESPEVDSRLYQLDLSKDQLFRVAQAALIARGETVANDPRGSGGQFAYIYGNRALRNELLPLGWRKDQTDNIEATFNPKKGIRLIYQNVDCACEDNRPPKAISGKGPAAKRMVDLSQPKLFPQWEQERLQELDEIQAKQTATVWFYCVAVNGDKVRAELSCPRSIQRSQFYGFHDRIYVIQDDDFSVQPKRSEQVSEIEDDVLIEISRK